MSSLAFKLCQYSLSPFLHGTLAAFASTSSLSIPAKAACKFPLDLPSSQRPFPMASWPCSKCTFLNENAAKACKVCMDPRGTGTQNSPSSSSSNEWPCKTCTFLNKFGRSNCEMCGAMATGTLSSLLIIDEEEAAADGFVGTRFRPLQSCSQGESNSSAKAVQSNGQKRPSGEEEEEGWVDMKKASKTSASVSASDSTPSIANSVLRDLHRERVSRATQAGKDSIVEEEQSYHGTENSTLGNDDKKQNTVIFLTYNVWFREDLEVHGRMRALGDLIEQHQPHFICLQEVTPNIYEIFRHSSWWDKYKCSISPQIAKKRAYFCIQLSRLPVIDFRRHPFRNSIMGRELCLADVETGVGKQLVVATTHLESPSPAPPSWNQMYSAERVFQAKESFNILKNLSNVIFGGDMNWDDRLDGDPPLPAGWYDVWVKSKPGQVGWTYDTKSNKMLTGNRLLQKRLDRIYCHLQDFEVESIDMIGADPIPGLSYTKEKKTKNQSQTLTLPVLPSDHYGLLMKLKPKC